MTSGCWLFGDQELTEGELLDFARSGCGEGVDEAPGAGHLVRGQSFAAVGDEFVLGGGCAGCGAQEGCGLFAPVVVGNADDGDVLDPGVVEQDMLYLAGEDVLASADDHLF